MAETNGRADDTVLVAYVTVHLQSGDSFELLPFEDPDDVKSKVNALLADWARSGFLIRGSRIYPWHQVRLVEATKVLELTRGESAQQRADWEARDLANLQQSFWKTKHPSDSTKDSRADEKGH